jgi:hypothetical protein
MKTVLPQINADERRFLHSELTNGVIRVFYDVYNELGHGFLEAVYQQAMCVELRASHIVRNWLATQLRASPGNSPAGILQ